jgi:Concanavalin A-like lectin/glucanases superfamily/Domain of unknown function (DUF2341)
MKFSRSFPSVAAGLAALACFCSHDYNPYADPSNARAVVSHASFFDNDTIPIFATETLQTMIAVRELVDSVSVVAQSNRRGPDTMVIRHFASAGPNTFLISFSDTGWATVNVSTFRTNGDRATKGYSLYCRSPLSQPDIRGNYGDNVALHAAKVSDKDVMYHWDFGNGVGIESPLPDTSLTIEYMVFDTVGWLWVSDPAGTNPSPKTRFSYYLKDDAGPKIICVNPSDSSKDTILTGDTTFYLRFKIWSPAQSLPVFSAQVNGDTFRIKEDPYYIQIFSRMDKTVGFIPVAVCAVDNQHFSRSTRDTFYLGFSNSIVPSNGIVLTVNDPSTDSSVSPNKIKGILGQIEDYSHDSIDAVVKMWLNNALVLSPDTVRAKVNVQVTPNWIFSPCTLSDGVNQIRLVAFSMRGDSLAAKTIQIAYDPTIRDTTPPVILEITADGSDVSRFYTPFDSAVVKIIAFDEASGMKAVLINGATIPAAPDGHGFIWYDTVKLIHTLAGNIFTVSAVDNDTNATKKSFTLFRNSAPVITHTPSFPDKIYVGSTYSDFLVWQDNDNDPVVLTKVFGTSSISVLQNGRIDWKPAASDAGPQTVTISLFDGYESVAFSFSSTVIGDTTNLPPQVRFATKLADFPSYLEVGHDSLMLVLKTQNDSGNGPLAFSAITLSGTSALVLDDSALRWHPVLADTGTQRLLVVVNDRYKRSDTLRPVIVVVPPNRPCSLFVASGIPRLLDGELDLSNATAPETLFFSVHDPDPPIAEQLTATIRWPLSQSVIGIDSSRKFILILDPKPPVTKSKDTVLVMVKDRVGHADSLSFFISYAPATPAISNGRTVVINTAGAGITQNALNFPLLVRLDKSFFPFDSVPDRGRDVRFIKSNGTGRPYEIDSWDSAGGTAAIWVLIDTVFANNATQNVQMSWSGTTGIDGSNSHAVFDTAKGFQGVWHLSDPSGNVSDATINALSGIDLGTPTGTSSVAGIIGNARAFDPAKQNTINLGGSPIICGLSDSITVSAWYKATPPEDTLVSILRCDGNFTALQIRQSSTAFTTSWNPVKRSTAWAGKFDDNQWHYFTAKYKTGSGCRVFTDGTLAAGDSINTGALAVPTGPMFTLGSTSNLEFFNGILDEVRIEKAFRSPDWIKLCYENQRPGSAMVTFR